MLKNEEILLLIYLIAIILIVVVFIVVFFIAFQRRKNRMLQEQYETEKHYQKELANSQIEIQEHTLKNIAWELHDNVGQLLSVANMQLNILSDNLPDEFKDQVGETKEIIKDTVMEIRYLSKVLNNDVVLKNGLVASLEVELERFRRLGYLDASIEVVGDLVPVHPPSAIIIFRILQESLSNVIKHAKASKLFVLLEYKDKSLDITLRDNGLGFDVNSKSFGSGMETMKSRAELIEASLIINSEPGKGTQLFLQYFFKHVR